MKQRLLILSLFVAVLAAMPSAAEKRPITEKDLFKFAWVADPQIAPDGSQVVFVRVTVNEKTDQYETSLWGREGGRFGATATADGGDARLVPLLVA
jgi:dipeptidyl aminopeptidase/acylaminoacyl peptidase